jgi:hypothetical protein
MPVSIPLILLSVMGRNRWARVVVYATMLALVISACGGDGGKDSISKAEFLAKGNVACKRIQGKILAEMRPFLVRTRTGQSLENMMDEIVDEVIAPNFEAEIQMLRRLGTPAGDKREVNAILAAIQDTVDKAKARPVAFSRSPNPYGRGEDLALAYGLDACGRVEGA